MFQSRKSPLILSALLEDGNAVGELLVDNGDDDASTGHSHVTFEFEVYQDRLLIRCRGEAAFVKSWNLSNKLLVSRLEIRNTGQVIDTFDGRSDHKLHFTTRKHELELKCEDLRVVELQIL